jgi:hypothetical protein
LTWFACVALLGACAHKPSAEQTAERFRELSRHEAELTRAEAERGRLIQEGASECQPPIHAATEQVCSEGQALCIVSKQLDDRDAETRCLRARDACHAAREHIRMRCR